MKEKEKLEREKHLSRERKKGERGRERETEFIPEKNSSMMYGRK